MQKFENTIEFLVWGRYALFSDPVTRMGGEKLTYSVPTYQALKGITESVYWKPSILWIVDSVRVINAIRTESKNVRPISYNSPGNDLAVYTYLADPVYAVRAHFIKNPCRKEPDVIKDGENYAKHYRMAKSAVQKGGRRDVFLGTRECQAYVEPCVYDEQKSYYEGSGTINLGPMFHSFAYPDEKVNENESNELGVRLWNAKMENGEIVFPPPSECEMYRSVHSMEPKKFGKKYKNFSAFEEGDDEN